MKKYIPELDGVRGIAILMVLLYHFYILAYGWLGVQLFFVLSGFLISGILLEEKNKPFPVKEKLKIFWTRRMLRIFPAYYLYLIILGITFLLFSFPSDYAERIIYLATYTFNFSLVLLPVLHSPISLICIHLWSLSVEEQFYLILPLIIFFLNRKHLKIATLIFILFSPLFRYLFGEYITHQSAAGNSGGGPIYWLPFSHMDAFFLGVFINVFNTNEWRHKKTYLLCFFVLVIFGGVMNSLSSFGEVKLNDFFFSLGYPLGEMKNYGHVWTYSLFNIFFMLLITVIVSNTEKPKSFLNAFFRFPILTSIGKVSYGMYIFHLALLKLFYQNISADFAGGPLFLKFLWFLLYATVVFFISYLSYRFFEMKFLKLKPSYAVDNTLK